MRYSGLALLILSAAGVAQGSVTFEDVSAKLPFTRTGGSFAGAAWLDYDRDGDLDLLLTNGAGGPCALFRNDGSGSFTDVAAAAGLSSTTGHSGVVAGDIDNDGYPDLFLSGEGGMMAAKGTQSRLYANNGDGTFTDITQSAGIDGGPSALSAAMGDLDGDGYLDLFITNSGSLATRQAHPNRLYHNNRNRTFTEIGAAAGVASKTGACACAIMDYDRDGHQDIVIANCNDVLLRAVPFELFRNQGDGTFIDVASQAGLGAGGFWMSVAPGDYDNDGNIDMFATNLGTLRANTPHALYRNNGNGTYSDFGLFAGVSGFEFGWGSTFADFDNDGDDDLFMAGSMPVAPFLAIGPGSGNPGVLLFNDGSGGLFRNAQAQPTDMSSLWTSGVARADYDGDGFVDLVVGVGPWQATKPQPILLHNKGNANRWVSVRLHGTVSPTDGVGAILQADTGGHLVTRQVLAGSSYLCSETPWPTFGLGSAQSTDITVWWPSGLEEVFRNVQAGSPVTLTEGTGDVQARSWTFGDGCMGSNQVPLLDAKSGSRPVAGGTFTLEASRMNTFVSYAYLVGASRVSWAGLQLPLSLASIGMTGCELHVAADIVLPATANSTGTGQLPIALPGNNPWLLGKMFHVQTLVLDPGANGVAVTSNALTAVIGN